MRVLSTSTLGVGAGVACALAIGLASAPAAMAQNRESAIARSFADMPPQEAPPASFYSTMDGHRFLLQRVGEHLALVRFEGMAEIYPLRVEWGAGNVESYLTDTGHILLRERSDGAMTLYRDIKSLGEPVQLIGGSAPVPPPQAPQGGLRAKLEALAQKAARALGRPLHFEAPEEPSGPQASGVMADAAERAAQSLASAPAQVVVRRVVIRVGDRPDALVVNESLTITVAPQMGYAGRPSSDYILARVSGVAPAPPPKR